MCAREWRTAAALGLTVAAALGCASHTAPSGFLPLAEEARVDAWGAWIDIAIGDPAAPGAVAGELLAVSSDSLWVLEQEGPRALAAAEVIDGYLVAWDSQYERVAWAAVAGTLSTVSNGFGLILTAPMWIIGGTIAAARQSRRPIRSLPPDSWPALAPFARFPQGLPAGLELERLRPRPLQP